jgi:chemotaxis response regulator CheB
MRSRRFFAIFGSPLFMDTVEAYLEGTPEVGVVRIHPPVPDVASRLQSLQPDVIIVDLNAPNLGFVVTVLQEQPTVPVFCLDLTHSKMAVLTGQHYTITSVDDLLKIVEYYGHPRDDSSLPLHFPDVAQMAFAKTIAEIQTEGKG